MGVNSISFGSPHARAMGRTCGEPNKSRKIPTRNMLPLFPMTNDQAVRKWCCVNKEVGCLATCSAASKCGDGFSCLGGECRKDEPKTPVAVAVPGEVSRRARGP